MEIDYKSNIIHIAIDSEFANNKFVSLQASLRIGLEIKSKFFFIDEKLLSKEIKAQCVKYCEDQKIKFIPCTYTDTESLLMPEITEALAEILEVEKDKIPDYKVQVYFYYSPKDIEFTFGFNNIKNYFIKDIKGRRRNFITQKRSIFGSFPIMDEKNKKRYRIRLRDLKGWSNSSLEKLAGSLNVKFKKDTLFDSMKDRMDLAFKKHPIEFIEYGIADTLVLHNIFLKKLTSTNKLMQEVLKMGDFIKLNHTC